ncbi:efflux transporter outer membrane subunit [Sphingomonas canadensis]|uniref:Efflux transporter outer membrane subunit n=1 Tax=Sphingomonas canadensis TaxID=1219257 RepID=A0ABW3H240_9SPHN|nr:efflux transporter outer membrane subunit [Sphingomonas canadensis]MCW3834666.1 efflux transporter outer membrane subunit [Sphingomonas canadensis]
MAPYRAKRRLCRALAFAPLLLCAACVAAPDLGEAPRPRSAGTLAAAMPAPQAGWPEARWWEGYGDPQLSALIAAALEGSPTMDEAEARVRRARAATLQAGAATLPSVELTGQGGASQMSVNSMPLPAGLLPHHWDDTAQAALGVSYDLDLWGRNRATLRAALSEEQAARADAEAARLTLSTAIASAYADLARLGAVRATAEGALRVRGESLDMVRAREAQGLENRAAVLRAESGRAAAAADLAAVDEQIALTRNRIAALMGEGPGRGAEIALPAAVRLPAFGLPADLGVEIVARRPDIVAARLRAEAQADRIGAARADFYPNIRLSALVGLQALGIGRLLDSGSTYGSVGPAITLPIFSGGRIEGGYRAARADYDAAVAAYDRTLIEALHDVADVAAQQRALSVRLADSRASLAASEAALELLRARYRGGLASYLEVLSAEDALNSGRRAVAELEASAFALDVALVRALGGGFQAAK